MFSLKPLAGFKWFLGNKGDICINFGFYGEETWGPGEKKSKYKKRKRKKIAIILDLFVETKVFIPNGFRIKEGCGEHYTER